MGMRRRLHVGDAREFFFFLLTRSIMKGKLGYFCGRCYARLGGRRVKDPHHSCGGDLCLFFAISHHSFSRRQCSVILPVSADAPQRTIVKQDPLAVWDHRNFRAKFWRPNNAGLPLASNSDENLLLAKGFEASEVASWTLWVISGHSNSEDALSAFGPNLTCSRSWQTLVNTL